MGTPEFAVPSLKALLDSDNKVLAVICQPDKPVGRKRELSKPATKKFAESKEENAAEIIDDVKKEEAQEKKDNEIEVQKEEKVPSTHDLKEQKDAKEENKEDKDRKEVEELTKELLKKGTLRKNN